MAPTLGVSPRSIAVTRLVSNSISCTSSLIHLRGMAMGRFRTRSSRGKNPNPHTTEFNSCSCCFCRNRSSVFTRSVAVVGCPLSRTLRGVVNMMFRGPGDSPRVVVHSRRSLGGRRRITIRIIRTSTGICITRNVIITRNTRVCLISITNHLVTANIGDVSVGGLPGRICITVAVCNSNGGCMAGIIHWSRDILEC